MRPPALCALVALWLALPVTAAAAAPPVIVDFDKVVAEARRAHWKLPERRCRELTGWRGEVLEGRCIMSLAANGRAAVLTAQTDCGGDFCSLEQWLITADRQSVIHLPTELEAHVEVLPDLRTAIGDRVKGAG